MTDARPTLSDKARKFASDLTETVQNALGPEAPRFVAEAAPSKTSGAELTRVIVRTDSNVEIPLAIDGEHALNLIVEYTCEWDEHQAFLAVRKAHFHVFSADADDPLFRYEFVDGMVSRLPSAHLHVHAHRDEMLYQMFRSERARKARTRAKQVLEPKHKPPRLSTIHFPMGGTRMRPALEDVLQTLIEEFCVDHAPKAVEALEAGRAEWRRHQIGALVRDAPAEAVRVLSALGYSVSWRGDGPEPSERTERLSAI